MDTDFKNLSEIFVQQADVGIGWADSTGLVKYINPALKRMLALDNAEEVYDQSVLQFYDPKTIKALEDQIFSEVMDKGRWIGELILNPKDGKQVKTMNYLFSMKDESGKLFSFGNIVLPIE